jgi:outer membrane biosynthesis protein TonB
MILTRQHCLFASAAGHGLLMLALVIGPRLSETPITPAQDHFFDLESLKGLRLTDDGKAGGGVPNPAGGGKQAETRPKPPESHESPPPPSKVPQDPPQDPPREPKNDKSTKPVDEPPPKNRDNKADKPDKREKPEKVDKKDDGGEVTTKPVKHPPVKIDTSGEAKPAKDEKTAVERERARKAAEAAAAAAAAEQAEADARAQARAEANERYRAHQRELLASLGSAASGVGKNTGSAVGISMPEGEGGEAYADYRIYLANFYKLKWQKDRPGGLSADSAVVGARITVGRDGKVRHFEVVRPSGAKDVDASVNRLLSRNTLLRPFPSESKDDERVFTLSFRVEAEATP